MVSGKFILLNLHIICRLIETITWVKLKDKQELALADGLGYYLHHSKEHCLVGLRGNIPEGCVKHIASDVILSSKG